MKLTRNDIGRDEMLRRLWRHAEINGARIVEQMKRLGGAWDWDKQYFTMDPQRSRAVSVAFSRLFDQGLIYRDNKIVSWCPTLRTALSDAEVESVEFEPGGGQFYNFVSKGQHKRLVPFLDRYSRPFLHSFVGLRLESCTEFFTKYWMPKCVV